MKTYPQPKNLTQQEKHFIIECGEDSSPLTKFLRKIKKYNTEDEKYFEFYLKCLNSGLNKYDNLKLDTVLHRRVNEEFLYC